MDMAVVRVSAQLRHGVRQRGYEKLRYALNQTSYISSLYVSELEKNKK